ncbi:MAG: hypothetical protein LBV32_04725 [Tannerellaceae bacterium]|jgi:hypothetical protein|nr:hypothetical protein [Tannerellaceae bacterium]
MNFYEKLSGRIHIRDIHEVLLYVEGNNERKQKLYELACHKEDTVAYHALWVFTHFDQKESEWLAAKQDELIDSVLQCEHPGKRRLLLNILFKQTFANPPRVDFLDFCLKRMLSKEELPGVQSLCMKLAYALCRTIPELLQEFKATLDIMETDLLPTSMRTVRKNVLKAMN